MPFKKDQILRDTNQLLRWSNLKKLQRNKIVKSSYIWLLFVPFVTKFFSKISDNLIFTIHNKIYELDLALPFSWKIFFISALFFAIGNLLFYIFAPNIVKDYSDYGDFENQGRASKELEDYFSSYEHEEDIRRIMHNEKRKNDNELFWEMYNFRDKNHNSGYRYIVSFLYLIGLALSAYIFIQSIFWVIFSWT